MSTHFLGSFLVHKSIGAMEVKVSANGKGFGDRVVDDFVDTRSTGGECESWDGGD
jgi:hypothetical protein